MIRVRHKDMVERFTGDKLADYLAEGRQHGPAFHFEDAAWRRLAVKHGPAGIGFTLVKNSHFKPLRKPTGCFGLGDLVHFLVKPFVKVRPRLGKCGQCQSRRQRWNRFRICWR